MKLRNFTSVTTASLLLTALTSGNAFSADTALTLQDLQEIMVQLDLEKANKADINAYTTEMYDALTDIETNFDNVNATLDTKADKEAVGVLFYNVGEALEAQSAINDEVDSKLTKLDETKADKADIKVYTEEMDKALDDVQTNFENVHATLDTKADKEEVIDQLDRFSQYHYNLLDEQRNATNTALATKTDKEEFTKLVQNVGAVFTAQDALNDEVDSKLTKLDETKADKADIKVYTEEMDKALDDVQTNFENVHATLDTKADKEAVGVLFYNVGEALEAQSAINDEVDSKLTKLDNTKADKVEVTQQINQVANSQHSLGSLLETKADKADVARVDNKINMNTAGIRTLDTRVKNNTALIQNIDDKVSKLDKKVRKGLAAQAALTGLFQPYNVGKANITAAVGGYKSNTALAIGTGYRFNEHVAAKAGVALSTGSGKAVSYNVGVNYEW